MAKRFQPTEIDIEGDRLLALNKRMIEFVRPICDTKGLPYPLDDGGNCPDSTPATIVIAYAERGLKLEPELQAMIEEWGIDDITGGFGQDVRRLWSQVAN